MSTLEIVAIGPASSVQDAGRFGAQRYGLTPSGAMDRLGLASANALLGNTIFAPAIELGPFGATFVARGQVDLALAGAGRPASIEGAALKPSQSFTLQEGERLELGFARDGVFSYLAVCGGIQGDAAFGSLAVNARAGLGSPYPRPLQAGDQLQCRPGGTIVQRVIALPAVSHETIRVVLGPQDDEFSEEAKQMFLGSDWTVSVTSDRMGYRLEGPAIAHRHGHNIVSDATVLGSIQVPGNGRPIVLMPDRGTSGGYPKIATVISADIGRLAQTPAGKPFRFAAIAIDEAQRQAGVFAALLKSLPDRVHDLRGVEPDLRALYDVNIAGDAVSALDAHTWHIEQADAS